MKNNLGHGYFLLSWVVLFTLLSCSNFDVATPDERWGSETEVGDSSSSSVTPSSNSVMPSTSSATVSSSSMLPSSNSTESSSGSVAVADWCATSSNCGTFTDTRDGTRYKWTKIGTQTWMAENLAYLPRVNAIADSSSNVAMYYVYDYDGTEVASAKTQTTISNSTTVTSYEAFGVLYNWTAAKAACPSGWHLPSTTEWTTLETYVGGSSTAGDKLKANSTLWTTNTGTDTYGFSALPGGGYSGGSFGNVGNDGYWWTASEYYSGVGVYGRSMTYGSAFVAYFTDNGFSVRCLQD